MNYSDTSKNITYFPSQKIANSKKNEKFYKKCIEAGIELCKRDLQDSIRLSPSERQVNINLRSDILDPRDIGAVFNPLNLPSLAEVYKDIKNYPIEASYFNLLVGEGSQRVFNWVAVCTNQEVNDRKINRQIDELTNFAAQNIQKPQEEFNKEDVEKELDSKIDKLKYSVREIEEVKATHVLNHVSKLNNLDNIFISTQHEQLVVGEEIVSYDARGGELYIDQAHSQDIFTSRQGDSNLIQDSDVIVHRTYMPTFTVMDRFKEDLSKSDLRKLDNHYSDNKETPDKVLMGFVDTENMTEFDEGIVDLDSDESNYADRTSIGETVRSNGDWRVCRVCWKSYREVKMLSTESDDGEVTKEIVDDNYEPNVELGETVEDIYIIEWLGGYQIGDDIFVKMEPFFGNSYNNETFELVSSPFVGYTYSLFGQKATCPMSQIKNLKYLYNIIRKEMESAIGRNVGNVVEMDLASIPSKAGWDLDAVLTFAKLANVKVMDSTEKIDDEDPNSRFAGDFNTTGKVVDWGQVNHIQFYSNILDQISNQIGEIMGLSPQRLGQISNRETKGGIERSVVQSSNTTEVWFKAHDFFKKMVYNNALQVSKSVYDGKELFIATNFDNASPSFINISGSEYASYNYSLFVSDSKRDTMMKEQFESIAPVLFQTDKLDTSSWITMMETDSVAVMKKTLLEQEKKKQKANQEAQQQQMKLEQEKIKVMKEQDVANKEHEITKLSIENDKDILIQEMSDQSKLELEQLKLSGNSNGVAEQNKINIDNGKLDLAREAESAKQRLAQDDLSMKKEKLDLDRLKVNKMSNNKNK